MTKQRSNPVLQAAQAAGSQANLARALGVSEPAIRKWVLQGWVPVRRAQEIEAQFGLPRTTLINPRLLDLIAAAPAL